MSDVMLFGGLKMPYEMAMASELSRMQFYRRVQQLVALVEAQQKQPKPQPEHEPVAWLFTNQNGKGIQAFANEPPPGLKKKCKPLYTTPPQPKPQPEQEPARTCCCAECGKKESDGFALYCVECMDKINALDKEPAQEPVAIPDDVRKAAQAMQKNGYRGPFVWASMVINFVADYAAPPKPQPLTDEQRKAVVVCFSSGKVSVSEVQRKLEIGYADAQKLCQSIVDIGLCGGLRLAPSINRDAAHGITGAAK